MRWLLIHGFLSFLIFFVSTYVIFSQSARKEVEAVRCAYPPKIDGSLDDEIWKSAAPAKDFIQYNPYNGKPPSQPTKVRILYDDRALYVGAMMYDSAPDSILRELGERDDDNINADFFTIDIVPYDDGMNAFEFKVAASGTESETKYAANYRDSNWNPIWKSAVEINDSGWTAEIEIPFAALRFPKKEVQTWGMNMWRNVRRHREFSTWNYVDNKMDGVFNQSGRLTGIRNIKPPLRLFFIPYVAGYTEKAAESNKWGYSYNYGMDMKLGLSESFTLDMTLIPDFGQVQSDDRIVNLSPFEVYYQERRPFFTEGTELFDRGNIFYSRRIGGTPDNYWYVQEKYGEDSNFTIKENPDETQLLNAIKISGRNMKGTAIGVFNAVNANTHAYIIDSTETEQKILTHPASNYNMFVFDQNLKNNSYISIYNTNVYRGRGNTVANVSGTEFEIRNKRDMYALSGRANISQQYMAHGAPEYGFLYDLEVEKTSGNFRYSLSHDAQNETYEINDMGFNLRNNKFEFGLQTEYNIYDPAGSIVNMFNTFYSNYNMLYAPREYVSVNMGYMNRTTFSNYLTAGFNWDASPFESHNYFEARVPGRMVKYPAAVYWGAFLSPDYRKRFVVDLRGGYWASNKYGQSGYNFTIKPRMRFSDRLSMTLDLDYDMDWNDLGYVTDSTAYGVDWIIFGTRDIRRLESTIDIKYIFTKNIALSLRARHYWITLIHRDYFDLEQDGGLQQAAYEGKHDFLVNAFNVDMVFRWTFAPGSELLFVYKNNIFSESEETAVNYFENIRYTFDSPFGNSFSIKVLYYFDYQLLKRKKRPGQSFSFHPAASEAAKPVEI
jgi:hypothetical protein